MNIFLKKESLHFLIKRKKLKCPISENDKFKELDTLLSTTTASLLGSDWANKNA